MVKNAENGVNQMYPTVDKPYIVSFVGSNTLDFPYYCNISQGYYRADEDGNVTFSGFGPGTEMYCSGLTNWENMLVDNFTMNWTYQPANYTVKSDELKIVCGVVTFFFKRYVVKNNILASTEWQIDGRHFLGLDGNIEEYNLHLPENNDFNWRAFVRFFDDGRFVSFDRQECGNSCFTNVYGRYSLPENNKLVLWIDSVNVNCTWAGGGNTTEIRNGAELTFTILNYSTAGFQLQKIGSTQHNANLIGTWKNRDSYAMNYF